jgi:hypothetical protein
MTRRRVLCGLLLASAVLACFGGWLWIARKPQVTRARFEQVKEGMTREEVIRTVGGPPGNYSRDTNYQTPFGPPQDWWIGDDAWLIVDFDDAETAIQVWVREIEPPTFTERIRRSLGL